MKRQARVNLYLTESEKEKLEQAAEKEGLPLSIWIRVLALKAADQIISKKNPNS